MEYVVMPIPVDRFTDVCALLGGASLAAISAGNAQRGLTAADMGQPGVNAKPATDKPTAGSETVAQASPASGGTGETATSAASPSDGEIDAHGHPWSADLHASTKGKTKDGLWRMKVGVSRPDPLPGFPVDNGGQSAATGTSPETPAPSVTSQTAADQGTGQPATSGDDEDEFAAFRAAAETSNATDQAAAAGVPARQYSDADLGALCNQAAVKLGDPNPIKEIIARFVPEGQVAHSRNIQPDRRAEFVKAVEGKAGVEFAG